jgi:hypothetical protein
MTDEHSRVAQLLFAYVKTVREERLANCYPLLSVLRLTARMLQLNALEARFVTMHLEIRKWNISNEVIAKYSGKFVDLLKASDCLQPSEFKRLQLYVILCAYEIKYTLCEHHELEVLKGRLYKHIKNFNKVFKLWIRIENQGEVHFDLKKVNKMGLGYYDNYNLLVEEVLKIAPPYNSHKDKAKDTEAAPVRQEAPPEQPESQSQHAE